MAAGSANNPMSRDIRKNFEDYAEFVQQAPINGRILGYLATGVRGALADPYTADALDGFDTSRIMFFLGEHDALVREYYPDALRGAEYDTETDPEVLSAELPGQLSAAKEILAAEDAQGVFAPSVSDTLEMLERRMEGARRGYLTAAEPDDHAAAGKELQRLSVQITAVVGRIKARLGEWLKRTKAYLRNEVEAAHEDAIGAVGKWGGAIAAVEWVVQRMTPVFEYLWKLVGNLPLPPI